MIAWSEWLIVRGEFDLEADPCISSAPHSHPQAGKLFATSRAEIVIELPNGLHVHFPREGYILREAK